MMEMKDARSAFASTLRERASVYSRSNTSVESISITKLNRKTQLNQNNNLSQISQKSTVVTATEILIGLVIGLCLYVMGVLNGVDLDVEGRREWVLCCFCLFIVEKCKKKI